MGLVMITTLAPTLWNMTDLLLRPWLAAADRWSASTVPGTASSRTVPPLPGEDGGDTYSMAPLIVIGIVVLIVCAYTLYFVTRDGYGPVPTRDDYDTRRPLP